MLCTGMRGYFSERKPAQPGRDKTNKYKYVCTVAGVRGWCSVYIYIPAPSGRVQSNRSINVYSCQCARGVSINKGIYARVNFYICARG